MATDTQPASDLLQKPGHAIGRVVHELRTELQGGEEAPKAVRHAGIHVELGWRAVRLQLALKDEGFVAERVHSAHLESRVLAGTKPACGGVQKTAYLEICRWQIGVVGWRREDVPQLALAVGLVV